MTADGLQRAANVLSVPVHTMMAVLEVETCGCGFLADKRPVILFERHIFSRRTGGQFDRAHQDISCSEPGGYGSTGGVQYARLGQAMKLHEDAALYSTSWGLGQIMGFNYGRAAFPDVHTMIAAFCDSEDAQLLAVANFILKSGLADELRKQDWSAFAYGYNGPGFARNDYDAKLREAHRSWARRGNPDCGVRAQQIALRDNGYYKGKLDGICGPMMTAALEEARRCGFLA